MKEYRRLPVQDSFELPTTLVAGDARYTVGTTPYTDDLTPFQRQSIPYITRLDD